MHSCNDQIASVVRFAQSDLCVFKLTPLDFPPTEVQFLINCYFDLNKLVQQPADLALSSLRSLLRRKDSLGQVGGCLLYRALLNPESAAQTYDLVKLLGIELIQKFTLQCSQLLYAAFHLLRSEALLSIVVVFKEMARLRFQCEQLYEQLLRAFDPVSIKSESLTFARAIVLNLSSVSAFLPRSPGLTSALFYKLLRLNSTLVAGCQHQNLHQFCQEARAFAYKLFQQYPEQCLQSGWDLHLALMGLMNVDELKPLVGKVLERGLSWCEPKSPFYGCLMSPATERALCYPQSSEQLMFTVGVLMQEESQWSSPDIARAVVKFLHPTSKDNRHLMLAYLLRTIDLDVVRQQVWLAIFLDWFDPASDDLLAIVPGAYLLQLYLSQDKKQAQKLFQFLFLSKLTFPQTLRQNAQAGLKRSFRQFIELTQLKPESILEDQMISFSLRHWAGELLKDDTPEQQYDPLNSIDPLPLPTHQEEPATAPQPYSADFIFSEEEEEGPTIEVSQELHDFIGDPLLKFAIQPDAKSFNALLDAYLDVARSLKVRKQHDRIARFSQQLSRLIYRLLQSQVEQIEIEHEFNYITILIEQATTRKDEFQRDSICGLMANSKNNGIFEMTLFYRMVAKHEPSAHALYKLLDRMYIRPGRIPLMLKSIDLLNTEASRELRGRMKEVPFLAGLV